MRFGRRWMPLRSLNVDVRRPDGRQVRVRVSVLPLLAQRKDIEPEEPTTVHAIDADQLEPPSALKDYLAQMTVAEPDGAVIRAAIFEPDLGRFLAGLDVHGPPRDPILV